MQVSERRLLRPFVSVFDTKFVFGLTKEELKQLLLAYSSRARSFCLGKVCSFVTNGNGL